MGTKATKQSEIWLDYLPAEILFHIFDYLTTNHILYAFFFLNQRFNNLLLQNPHYLRYLELPATNLDLWKQILPLIRHEVESLNIISINLSFSLKYFPNLKSVTISSPYGYPEEQLQLVFKNDLLFQLHSFRIKQNQISNFYLNSHDNYVLEKVFSQKSSLKIFHYSFPIDLRVRLLWRFETNLNIHSLKLILRHFDDMFTLISFTPNLEYLNVQCQSNVRYPKSINKIPTKLKQFYLTSHGVDLDELIILIQQFSSSLTRLSLDFSQRTPSSTDKIPYGSTELRIFLESIPQLKQFYLYTRIHSCTNSDILLSNFNNQYWYDHQWFFGTHQNYFYTLPFHFDNLYEFSNNFHDVKSNNPQMLLTNPRLWYSVKSIELRESMKYDLNFWKELQIKMPNLTFIKTGSFIDFYIKVSENLSFIIGKRLPTFGNVTTIEYTGEYNEDINEWMLNTSPNLNHLILSSITLPTETNEIDRISNKNIQTLDLIVSDPLKLAQIIEISYVYFPNIQQLCLNASHNPEIGPVDCSYVMKKVLQNRQNLQTLLIRCSPAYQKFPRVRTYFYYLVQQADMKEIQKKFQMEQFSECILFSKKS